MRAALTTGSRVHSEGAGAAAEIAARWSPGIGVRAPMSRMAVVADRVGMGVLLLTAGAQMLRPADLIPALADWEIHKYLMAACLVLALGRVLTLLNPRALRENAIGALVLALVPAVVLSHLSHLDTWDARLSGIEMAKTCLFFVLVVGLVDSSGRLKLMLGAAAAAVFGVTALAIGQHYDWLHLPALAGVVQSTGDASSPRLLRLCGTGVFNDPNDFSLVIVLGGVVCAYGLFEGGPGRWRLILLAPLGLLGYALILTHSRGGLMAAVAAVLTLAWAKMGWRSAAMIACAVGAVLLLPVWGRQTNLNLADPEDTFQTRIYLWGESMNLFRSSPLFGIGEGKVADVTGHVTHNSFLHAFTEMGVLGGVAFVGVFYLIVRGLGRSRPVAGGIVLARLRPYVLAIVVGYAVGLLSLSRCYTVPTQFVLALGAAFLMVEARSGGIGLPRLDWVCVRCVAGVGALFLAGTYVFIRVMMWQVQS